MPVIQTKTPLNAGETGNWVPTDTVTNIVVGVKGSDYIVEYNLGSDIVYQHFIGTDHTSTVIAKANEVRVTARSAALNFEVFA